MELEEKDPRETTEARLALVLIKDFMNCNTKSFYENEGVVMLMSCDGAN